MQSQLDSEASLHSRLLHWVRKLSYREGDFVLSSGQRSSFYIDLKATTLHPEGAALIGRAMAGLLEKMRGGPREQAWGGVGGLTLGADPIATAVSLSLHQKGIFCPAFIVRKEPKGHGTGRWVEGRENLDPSLPLVVVEDVSTTGKSALLAVERLREEGFHPSVVLSVVDRESGAAQSLEKAGVQFAALLNVSELHSTSIDNRSG